MFEIEYHPEMLLITPSLGVTEGGCDDPHCDLTHWRISLGWLFWSFHFAF